MKSPSNVRAAVMFAVLLVLALGPRPGEGVENPTTSNEWLAIAGEVTVDPGPCMPGGVGEVVALTGQAHVVAQVLQPVPTGDRQVRLYVNLGDVTGVGLTTGLAYHAVGASKIALGPVPTGDFHVDLQPVPTGDFQPFDLVQAGPCGSLPGAAPVSGTLVFVSDALDATASSLRFVPTGR